MSSESVRGGGTMKKKGFIIYGSYLGVIGIIALAMQNFGLSTTAGLWIALIVAVGYAITWPR